MWSFPRGIGPSTKRSRDTNTFQVIFKPFPKGSAKILKLRIGKYSI
jgi:hypothetical protein